MKMLGDLVASLLALLRALFVDGSRMLFRSRAGCCATSLKDAGRAGGGPSTKRIAILRPARRSTGRSSRRPDPLIYAQFYFMSLGFAVTWDNPDITLEIPSGRPRADQPVRPAESRQHGALVRRSRPTPDTTSWRGSGTARPLPLWWACRCSSAYLSFGMGVKSQPIGSSATEPGREGRPRLSGVCARALAHAERGRPLLHPGAARRGSTTSTRLNNLRPGEHRRWAWRIRRPTSHFRLGNPHPDASDVPLRQPTALRHSASRAPCALVDRAGRGGAAPPRRAARRRSRRWPGRAGDAGAAGGRACPTGGRGHFRSAPGSACRPSIPPRRRSRRARSWTIQASRSNRRRRFRGRAPVNVHGFSERGLAGGVTLYVERS